MNTIPLQEITDEKIRTAGLSVHVLRTDLLHETYGGNKWFKLKYNLEAARKNSAKQILTFGGAFSNHIAATAAACRAEGFHAIGVIRGEEQLPLNPTLSFAKSCGMQLHYVDRSSYRQKQEPAFLEALENKFGAFYHLPEGGANLAGVKGCTEILAGLEGRFDTVMLACGTGSTLAGIALSLQEQQRVLGVPVFRNGEFLRLDIDEQIRCLLEKEPGFRWQHPLIELLTTYHFGGYAKQTPELFQFVSQFEKAKGIPLDYIYTAKMLYAFYDLLEKDFFRQGERILLVHTGGLQGNAGITMKNSINS